jgi:hypothetical protein
VKGGGSKKRIRGLREVSGKKQPILLGSFERKEEGIE